MLRWLLNRLRKREPIVEPCTPDEVGTGLLAWAVGALASLKSGDREIIADLEAHGIAAQRAFDELVAFRASMVHVIIERNLGPDTPESRAVLGAFLSRWKNKGNVYALAILNQYQRHLPRYRDAAESAEEQRTFAITEVILEFIGLPTDDLDLHTAVMPWLLDYAYMERYLVTQIPSLIFE